MEIENTTRISYLISRHLTDTLTEAEQAELSCWLAESESNRQFMEKFYKRHYFTQKQIEENLFAAYPAFLKVKKRNKKKNKLSLLTTVVSVAAIVSIFFGVALVFKYIQSNPQIPSITTATVLSGESQAILTLANGRQMKLSGTMRDTIWHEKGIKVNATGQQLEYIKGNLPEEIAMSYNTLTVPRKGEFHLMLADGTKVWMNSESSLRYPMNFEGNERRVYMEGEAYFEVAKNPSMPFIVETGTTQVKVLGTSFNLRAYEEERNIYATLTEGAISLISGKQSLNLKPDEQGVVDEQGNITKKQVEVNLYTSWKDGRFIFQEQELEDIMNTLSRWYDIEVFFANEAVRHVTFSGNLKRYDSFNQIIDMLEMTDMAHFKITGNAVFVTK